VNTAVAIVLLAAAIAGADGGTMRVHQAMGPLVVSAFTAPQPPDVGPLDVSVLVQRADGSPVLDAEVGVELTSLDGGTTIARNATHAAASNKLMYVAVADMPAPGAWRLDVTVRSTAARGVLSTTIPVGAPTPRVRALWPYLALPPVGMLVFALHQRLAARRRGVDRHGSLAEDGTRAGSEDLDDG
jgi:hypothetical protein